MSSNSRDVEGGLLQQSFALSEECCHRCLHLSTSLYLACGKADTCKISTHDFLPNLCFAFNLSGTSMDNSRNSSEQCMRGYWQNHQEEMPCRNQNRRLAKQSALEKESKSWQHMKKQMRQSIVTLKSHTQARRLPSKGSCSLFYSDFCPCRSWTIPFNWEQDINTSPTNTVHYTMYYKYTNTRS